MTDPVPSKDLVARITAYLASGGLFNPELANHEAVRDLLIECRDTFSRPTHEREPPHCSTCSCGMVAPLTDDILLTHARAYDQGPGATFEFDQPTLLAMLRSLAATVEGMIRDAPAITSRTVEITDEQRQMLTARGVDEIPSHDESQCWEPCGELGKSAEHARLAPEPGVSGVKCTHCNGSGEELQYYDEETGWSEEKQCATCKGTGSITSVEQYLKTVPANWHEDSSLQTWFPLTEHLLRQQREQIDSLLLPRPTPPCECIPVAPRPWNYCQDCGGRITQPPRDGQ